MVIFNLRLSSFKFAIPFSLAPLLKFQILSKIRSSKSLELGGRMVYTDANHWLDITKILNLGSADKTDGDTSNSIILAKFHVSIFNIVYDPRQALELLLWLCNAQLHFKTQASFSDKIKQLLMVWLDTISIHYSFEYYIGNCLIKCPHTNDSATHLFLGNSEHLKPGEGY